MSKHGYHRGVSSSVKLLVRLACWLLGITMLASGATQAASAAQPRPIPEPPSDNEITQPIARVVQTSPLAPAVPALNAPATPAVPAAPASIAEHTVVSGDSYSKIGNKYGADWKCLANENGAKPPYVIHPGDKIRIPDSCKGGHSPGPKTERGPPPADPPAHASGDSGPGKAQRAVDAAMSKIGAKYVYGAEGPNSFDCSGLVMWAYDKAGVDLPRTSRAMSGTGKSVSRGDLRPGDLVFFYKPVSHVAMYIGDGKIVHASTSKKPVRVSELSGYYVKHFSGARRVA